MSTQNILAQAQLLIDQEEYERAYDVLKNSYENYKSDAEFLEKIALVAKTIEKNDEAVQYWEELVKIDNNSLVGYSELLDIYVNTNKYKYYITRAKYKILNNKISQSIDDYKKAISSTAEEEEIINARFLLAKVYEHVGKTQNAIDEYFRIVEHNDDAAVFYKLADLYCEINDRYSAINVLERAVKAFPDSNELSEYLSGLYLREGQYDKALEFARNNYSKTKAYLMMGDNEAALKLLQETNDETNANYFALYAEYWFNLKNYDKCLEYIDKFKNLAPDNPLVYQMKALVCDEQGNSYGYHYNMGRCYSFKQDYELALSEYLNAHRNNPNGTEAIKEIIKINEAAGDKTSLMEFYEKLIKQEPENLIALKGLGDIYADMYEFKIAIEFYEKLIKIDSNNYEIYKKLGNCYEKLRYMKQAKDYYEKFIAIAPLSPDTELLKDKVSKMKITEADEATDADEGIIDKILKLFGK